MDVNTVTQSNAAYLLQMVNSAQNTQQSQQMGPPPPPPDGADAQISGMGKIMNAVSQMSEADQQETREYMDTVMQSIKDGTFDSSALAEEMPEAFRAVLEEQGIDVQDHLNDVAEHAQKADQMKAAMPYNASGMQSSSAVSSDDEEEDYWKNLFEKLFAEDEEEDANTAGSLASFLSSL